MMKLIVVATLSLISAMTFVAEAGEKMSDAGIKQKLLGYWKSPRHGYEYTSDGIMHTLGGTSKSHCDVQNGVYYEDSDPCDISLLRIVSLSTATWSRSRQL